MHRDGSGGGVGASGHRHRDARARRGRARRGGGRGGGRSRGAGLAAPSMRWRCGWPAAWARRQLWTVEPVKALLQRRSRWARGQEGGMRTPRAGPMGCCCRYTPALSTRATNVASSGGSSGSECRGGGARMQGGAWGGVGCKVGERPHSADLGGATPMMPSEAEPMLVRANNWARDTPFPAGTRAESAAAAPFSSLQQRRSASKKVFLGFTCGRRHGGGTHRRPLWYIWRGSPRARGSPGLTAAVAGRAQPCRPPAEPGLNPPSPPTPTGRWDSPGAPGGKILCRWGSPGRSD